MSLMSKRDFDGAEPQFLAAHRILSAMSNEKDADLRQATEGLAALYEAWNRPDQAAAWRKKITSAKK